MIDKQTIEKIAKLARLQITDVEAMEYSEQLSKALAHFEQIAKVDTTGVEPLVTPSEIEHTMREDVVVQLFTAEQMTENAPAKIGNLFKVPPVVG
jgi:aspartyl-tRNA(Asn)/glutamyl-tRNA(Gln) amidotransferase subunit C